MSSSFFVDIDNCQFLTWSNPDFIDDSKWACAGLGVGVF